MAIYKVYPTEEQEKLLRAFLEESNVSFVKDDELPLHVLEGIAEGKADFEAGRFITLEEFKKKFTAK